MLPLSLRTLRKGLRAVARRLHAYSSRASPAGWIVDGGAWPPPPDRRQVYAALRAAGHVAPLPGGSWAVVGHAAAHGVLRDGETFSSSLALEGRSAILGYDGPRHAAIQGPLLAAFAARHLGGRGGWIRSTARGALRDMAACGETDLVEGAIGASIWRMMGGLFGLDIPEEESAAWGPHLRRYTTVGATADTPADRSFRAAAGRLFDRVEAGEVTAVVAALRSIPGFADSKASFERNLALLLWAGISTTQSVLVGAVAYLLDEPALERALRADRSLLPAFVAELLRLKPAHIVVPRLARQSVELDGQPIAAGDTVYVLIEPVNRDPAVFDDPDTFRMGRWPRSLSFGYGPHYCPGHFWAREEILGTLDVFLDAWPSFHAALDPAEGPGPFVDRAPGPIRFRTPPRVAWHAPPETHPHVEGSPPRGRSGLAG